jgi:hypothetical protein
MACWAMDYCSAVSLSPTPAREKTLFFLFFEMGLYGCLKAAFAEEHRLLTWVHELTKGRKLLDDCKASFPVKWKE